EALELGEAFLASVYAGSPHLLEWQVTGVLAEIRLARGDVAGAIRDTERVLATSRDVEESQGIYFVRTICAHLYCAVGQPERASLLVHEVLDLLRRGVRLQFASINLPLFVVAAERLELVKELVDALADHPQTRWTDAARAWA